MLVNNDIISGLSEEDINSIINQMSFGPESVIYFKKDSCGDSYFKQFNESGDLGNSGWLISTGERCKFNGYKNGGCPSLKCCGDYLRGKLIVGFNKGVSEETANELMSGLNLEIDSSYGFGSSSGLMVVKVPEGEEASLKEKLESKEIISSVEFDGIVCPKNNRVLIPDVSNLLFLPLNNDSSTKDGSTISSTLIYWIVGIVILLLIIILIFVLTRNNK